MNKKTIYFGMLVFILLTSGIIFVKFTSENLKMRIDGDKTTFYTLENSRWVVSGREFNKLFDGTKLLYRDKSSIKIAVSYTHLTLPTICSV